VTGFCDRRWQNCFGMACGSCDSFCLSEVPSIHVDSEEPTLSNNFTSVIGQSSLCKRELLPTSSTLAKSFVGFGTA
jgi:hypothetical protein